MISKFCMIAAILGSVSSQYPHEENQNSAPSNTRYAIPVPVIQAHASPYYNVRPKLAQTIPVTENQAEQEGRTYYTAGPIPNVRQFIAAPTVVTKYASEHANQQQHLEEYAHPKYEYAYSVEDHHTGDSHSQQERRDGDHVIGQYSLHEADGTIRIVKYYDVGHGFNAVVEKQGTPTEAPPIIKKVQDAAGQY